MSCEHFYVFESSYIYTFTTFEHLYMHSFLIPKSRSYCLLKLLYIFKPGACQLQASMRLVS